MIAGIVLAAGGSTRMGRPKALLPWGRTTVLAAGVERLLEAGLERVFVVLGADAERVRIEGGLPSDPRVSLVDNVSWREGMASSIRAGVAAADAAGMDAVVMTLADQPGITAERVRSVLAAFAPGRALAVPMQGGIPSHPILFGRSLFPELMALEGDAGAREVVRRNLAHGAELDLPPLPDLDTPEDYARLAPPSEDQ